MEKADRKIDQKFNGKIAWMGHRKLPAGRRLCGRVICDDGRQGPHDPIFRGMANI